MSISKMFNKFKNGERVLVNGIGKNTEKYYYRKRGYVICRDPYYKDYNIRFPDGTEDWFDTESLRKSRKENKENGNKKN